MFDPDEEDENGLSLSYRREKWRKQRMRTDPRYRHAYRLHELVAWLYVLLLLASPVLLFNLQPPWLWFFAPLVFALFFVPYVRRRLVTGGHLRIALSSALLGLVGLVGSALGLPAL
ncbi:hypothetical protein [Microbacterium sp. Leaf151]|uniref:hypothetical protein n=1 Tax=Microbacterium sp. Leaf151 TaxID=1736276 RepID=UPI0006F9783F|nr:hypothetical protein [Microbacterium sp. Leaf151]KQR25793.1 hypothetical protein ASF76_00350 [Microbacterium sp. Leaf151]